MERKPVKLLVCKKCGTKNSVKRKKCRKCGAKLKRNLLLKIAIGIAVFFALVITLASFAPEEDASLPENNNVPATLSEPLETIQLTIIPTVIPTETPTVTEPPIIAATPTPDPTPEITISPEPTIESTTEPTPESVYMQPTEPMRVIVEAESIRVYQSPDETSVLLGEMKTDTVMLLHSIENGWAEVENEKGDVGYAEITGLTRISQSEYVNLYANKEILRVIVTADSVNVYELPDETSKFLGAMKKGSIMRIHEIQDGWAKVENEKGAVGYAKIDALKVLNEKEYAVQVTPTPKPANKSYVWVTEKGKSYHSSSQCSNMNNPRRMELSKAKSRGYTRCPKCW